MNVDNTTRTNEKDRCVLKLMDVLQGVVRNKDTKGRCVIKYSNVSIL